ncbi:hypothetical protein EON65_58960 [archaeon]|nr:MAG: hypothetical protein EON65_58960 [archaeon]
MSFAELAYEFLSLFIHSDQIPSVELRDICNRSFENFRSIGK